MSDNLNDKSSQEIVKDIYQLNVKIRVLESNIESYLGCSRNSAFDILNKSLSESRRDSKTRSDDYLKLKKRISEIRNKTDRFKSSIENIQPNENFVSSVKELMEEIETILTEFKHEQKKTYENLLRSEISLWQECLFMEKKIDSWTLVVSNESESKKTKANPTKAIDQETNPITNFEKFLIETGGKTGGWATIDHETFLKIRRKHCRNRSASQTSDELRDENTFIDAVTGFLAPKSIREVREHELWYRKYQQLLDEKKRAISEWKIEKSKKATGDVAEICDRLDTDNRRQSNWNVEKSRLEEQRKQLDAWRTQKALEQEQLRMEREANAKLEMEKKKQELEKERKEMREMVDQYKQKKLAEESEKMELELKSREMERIVKKKQTEINSARISERNSRMIEERMIKQHRKQFEQEQRIERLEDLRSQVSVTAPRDPARLLRPTSVWTHRLAECAETDTSRSAASASTRISNVQHKAVPSWRRDMVL